MIATMQAKVGRDQRHVRWKGSTRVTSLAGGAAVTATVVSVSGVGITIDLTAAQDTYLGWYVDDGVELRRVAHSNGALIVVATAFGATPTIGSTLTLRQGFLPYTAGRTVLRVTDTTNGRDLEIVRPEDVEWNGSPTPGDPVGYYHLGNRVYLDPVPTTERYFLVEEESYPTLTGIAGDAELPIPEPLQYAAVLWTIAWGFGRYLNPKMKSALRQEWRETLIETQLPEDNAYDRQDEAIDLRRE